MFTGVHILAPALMDRLRPVFSDVIRDAYIPALRAGATIRAVTLTGYFAEHSTPERYLESNRALLGGARLRHPPGRLTGVDPTARIHPTASIASPVKIGAGAVIGPGVEIGPDTVVGEGAVVTASISGAIVFAGARVESPGAGPIVSA